MIFLCLNKLIKQTLFIFMAKQNEYISNWFSLNLVDPATFPVSNTVLSALFSSENSLPVYSVMENIDISMIIIFHSLH